MVSRRRPKERGRPVVERSGRFVLERGQELNTEHAQKRTLLDRQRESKSSPNVRRRLRNPNSGLIMTDEFSEIK